MVIPETSVWVSYLNGVFNAQTEFLNHELDTGSIAFLDLILCEVLQGIRDDKTLERTRRRLDHIEVLETGGETLAVAAASNYRFLRKRGITIRSTIDCLIATFCIENGHTLIHNDRDYDPFEQHLGLQVLRPA